MIFRIIAKIVFYFLIVFVMMDIIIFINYILKDYGENLNMAELNRAAMIFLPSTIGLFIANYFLKKFRK